MREPGIENKELLIINQDSGYLMIDLANAFTEKGFSVTLLTGRLVIRNNKLKDTVKVQKIIKYNRKSNSSRLYTWSVAFIQILLLLIFKYRKSTLLIVTNPPFGLFIPLFVKNRFSLFIFDVFPDAISELGILKPESMIIRRWERINHRVYRNADNILTITEGMKDLVQKYALKRKIEVIPLWSDNGFFKHVKTDNNPFIQKNNLSGKFVVMYSGNIGATQRLEILVEIAKLSVSRPDIVFLIIGDGIMRRDLEYEIKSAGLHNCVMIPWQEPENIPFSLAAANLAVVSLGKLSSSISIPSKFYNFLSVGSPILGIGSPESELASIIKKLNVGTCFDPSEKEEITTYIQMLADNKEKYNELYNNSLKAATYFTPENAKKAASIFCDQISQSRVNNNGER
jgi:glycosyltransferase involved in cell wall biosynthesis